jgi:hypothetical protein
MTSADVGSSNVKPSDGSGPIHARSIGVKPGTLHFELRRRAERIRNSLLFLR